MGTDATILDVAESTANFTLKLAHLVRRWPGTQKALASKVGVSPQVLSQYMRGAIPKPHTILLLARELGVEEHLDWLMDEAQPSVEPPWGDVPSGARLLADATPHQLLKHLVDGYLKIALPLREKLDELASHTAIDYTAIWLLSNNTNKVVPEPIADMAKLIFALSAFVDGLWLYDFDTALEEEINRRKLEHTPAELNFSFLYGDWKQLRLQNPGIDALIEYCNVSDEAGIEELRNPILYPNFDAKRKASWMQQRAPHLLAHLVTHENNKFNPKVQHLIEILKQHGYLDESGKPVEPRTLADAYFEMSDEEVAEWDQLYGDDTDLDEPDD